MSEIVAIGPVSAASVVWRDAAGAPRITVAARLTYELTASGCSLAAEQEPIADVDLVPFKRRADVVLVGSAYAPNGEPVRALRTRLLVGEVDKCVDVFLDRVTTLDGEVREAARFTRMPIGWERAAFDERENPIGIRVEERDTYGRARLPNLMVPGASAQPSAHVAAVGYGPIDPAWPVRADRAGGAGPRFDPAGGLPADLDPAFFQGAPRDQQGRAIRPDERIVLENLHPDAPRLVVNLPNLEPRAFFEEADGGMEELALVGDTLSIDTDRRRCVVTFRAHRTAGDPARRGFVLLDDRAHPLTRAEATRLIRGARSGEARGSVLELIGATIAAADGDAKPALPFVEATLDAEPPTQQPSALGRVRAADASDTLSTSPRPVPGPAWLDRRIDPMVRPEVAPSPWAAGAPPGDGGRDATSVAPRPTTEGERRAAMAADEPILARPSIEPPSIAPPPSPCPVERSALDLVWIEPGVAARVRAHDAFGDLLAGLTAPPRLASGAAFADPAAARDVLGVLSLAPRASWDVEQALDLAVDEGGALVPPLILLEGRLQLRFDDIDTLRATIAASQPFAGADKKLKEAIAAAEELVATPWAQTSNQLVTSLRQRLHDGVARAAPSTAAQLDDHVLRMLLEGRRYQRRSAFGGVWIRAAFGPLLERDVAVPAYLPDALSSQLPVVPELWARALVEVRPQHDPSDAHPAALLVLALARVVALRPRATRPA